MYKFEDFLKGEFCILCHEKQEKIMLLQKLDDLNIKWACGEKPFEFKPWEVLNCFVIFYGKLKHGSSDSEIVNFEEVDFGGNDMELNELKNGYVVKLRNGKLYLCLNNHFVGLENIVSNVDCNYQSDMTYLGNDRFDVMKVYTINNYYTLNDVFSRINPRAFNLVWEREKVVELTVAQISEKLGYKVKVVE